MGADADRTQVSREQSPARRKPVPSREADGESGADAAHDAILRGAGRNLADVASTLSRADGATRAWLTLRLQQECGNAYVQRLIARRAEAQEDAGWQSLPPYVRETRRQVPSHPTSGRLATAARRSAAGGLPVALAPSSLQRQPDEERPLGAAITPVQSPGALPSPERPPGEAPAPTRGARPQSPLGREPIPPGVSPRNQEEREWAEATALYLRSSDPQMLEAERGELLQSILLKRRAVVDSLDTWVADVPTEELIDALGYSGVERERLVTLARRHASTSAESDPSWPGFARDLHLIGFYEQFRNSAWTALKRRLLQMSVAEVLDLRVWTYRQPRKRFVAELINQLVWKQGEGRLTLNGLPLETLIQLRLGLYQGIEGWTYAVDQAILEGWDTYVAGASRETLQRLRYVAYAQARDSRLFPTVVSRLEQFMGERRIDVAATGAAFDAFKAQALHVITNWAQSCYQGLDGWRPPDEDAMAEFAFWMDIAADVAGAALGGLAMVATEGSVAPLAVGLVQGSAVVGTDLVKLLIRDQERRHAADVARAKQSAVDGFLRARRVIEGLPEVAAGNAMTRNMGRLGFDPAERGHEAEIRYFIWKFLFGDAGRPTRARGFGDPATIVAEIERQMNNKYREIQRAEAEARLPGHMFYGSTPP